MKIYNNGLLIAEVGKSGYFEIFSDVNVTDKSKKIIELLNNNPKPLEKIKGNNLSIHIDSSKFNYFLSGIAPGYVDRNTKKIYALETQPLFFLFIIIVFEANNYTNDYIDRIEQNITSYKSENDFAKAYEKAEFKTYEQSLSDITQLYINGNITIPWYFPFTINKNSFTGLLIRGLSKVLPAKFMLRYLAPMDLNDWLTETSRKSWYFYGDSHMDNYRQAYRNLITPRLKIYGSKQITDKKLDEAKSSHTDIKTTSKIIELKLNLNKYLNSNPSSYEENTKNSWAINFFHVPRLSKNKEFAYTLLAKLALLKDEGSIMDIYEKIKSKLNFEPTNELKTIVDKALVNYSVQDVSNATYSDFNESVHLTVSPR